MAKHRSGKRKRSGKKNPGMRSSIRNWTNAKYAQGKGAFQDMVNKIKATMRTLHARGSNALSTTLKALRLKKGGRRRR